MAIKIKQDLLNSIVADLGANFQRDDYELLGALLDDVINDALFVSNRDQLVESEEDLELQIKFLSSNIKKCVKSIYLQRGAEDVSLQSISGLSSSYDDAIETMKNNIIRTGKRILM